MSTWYNLLRPAMERFRIARANRIRDIFPQIDTMNVVDLGGSTHFWKAVGGILEPKSLVIMNIAHDGQSLADGSSKELVQLYDGKHIPYPDKSIDLLICNSVIEHVPPEQRADLAVEIDRVAKNWIVQTPAAEFPLELHFVAPFIHWLPRKVGRAVAPWTPYGFLSERRRSAKDFFDEIQLLTRAKFQQLFRGTLITERFLGLPKSYLIYEKE